MHEIIKKYTETLPELRRQRIEIICDLILKQFPEITIDLKYKMPTFHLDEGWVAVANQKNYVSLYTCGYHHIESFKIKHPRINTGKGCIRFKDKDELPQEDLLAVIEHAIAHPKPEM